MEILNERAYKKVTSLTATFTVSPSGVYTLEYEDLYTGESFSASASTVAGAATSTTGAEVTISVSVLDTVFLGILLYYTLLSSF